MDSARPDGRIKEQVKDGKSYMNIGKKQIRLSTIRISILVLCIFSGLIIIKYIFDSEKKHDTDVIDFCVESKDSEIVLSWDVSAFTKIDYIEITVQQDDLIVEQTRVSCAGKKYSFTDGEHGELYSFRMIPHIRNGENGDLIEKDALFLMKTDFRICRLYGSTRQQGKILPMSGWRNRMRNGLEIL